METPKEIAENLRIIADGFLAIESPDYVLRGILIDAAKTIDSLRQENEFLKSMQRQLAGTVDHTTLGMMVLKAKYGGA